MRQSHELKYLGEIIRADYSNKVTLEGLLKIIPLREKICCLLKQQHLNDKTTQRFNSAITNFIATIHASYIHPKTTQALSYCFQKAGLSEPIGSLKYSPKANHAHDEQIPPNAGKEIINNVDLDLYT